MGTLAFVFPGQGSQQVGMAADEASGRYLALAEKVSGLDIYRYCVEGPIEELTRTEIAQPALFAVGLALAEAARGLGLEPSHLAGHSLGEYTAAVVSGALSVEDGMNLVCERGRLMAAIQSERPGAMGAVMGLVQDQVQELCRQAGEAGHVSLANLNTPTQLVVSGDEAGVLRVLELAQEAGARHAVRLQVGAAFHTELMVPVYERLRERLNEVSLGDPRTPLVSIWSAEVLASADQVREALSRQIVNPVRWVEVVQTMLSAGCSSFLELGPGRVLSGLIRQIDREAERATAGRLTELEAFAAARG